MEVSKCEHEFTVFSALIAFLFVTLTTDVLECPCHVGFETTGWLLGQFDSTLENWHWEAGCRVGSQPESVICVDHRRIELLFFKELFELGHP